MDFIIIDDSTFDLFTQEKLLLKSGLASSITTFPLAQAALDYLISEKENITDTVILLDLQMPGLNGFEFTEQFGLLPSQIRDKVKLYMISSTVDLGDIQKAADNEHIIQLLSKPLEIGVLKKLLGR